MIKKILILLFLLLITAYLIVAVTAFNTKPADQVCKGMELIIKDSIDHGFISQKGILRLLNGKKLSPVSHDVRVPYIHPMLIVTAGTHHRKA